MTNRSSRTQRTARGKPSRYHLDCGEAGSVTILDYKIVDMRSFYEHHIYHEGHKVGSPTLCPSKFDTCHACEGAKKPYHTFN